MHADRHEHGQKYWAEAVSTANFLQNILPNRGIKKTPYELWNKQTADVGRLRIFGLKGYTHVSKEKRRKLDDKATLLTFVGYSLESKAYRRTHKLSRCQRTKGFRGGLQHQEQYIQKIVVRFGLEDAKISKIPMDTGYRKIIGDKKPMVSNDIVTSGSRY